MSKRFVMLNNRYMRSFMITSLFYIGAVVWFLYFPHKLLGTEQKPKEKIMILSMSEFIPEKQAPVKEIEPEKVEIAAPEPEPIKEETKTKEPVAKEVIPEPIVQKVIPKPVVAKVVKKKSVKKKKVKKRIKKKVKKRVHKKTVHRKITKKRKHAKSASKPQASPAKKNRFLNQLRAKINRYKTYPRIAQRRGMQGSVKVRFTILANGEVGNISVSGPKVFYASVKRAVKKAFPISVKNASLSLPITVNVTLRYQIK